MLIKNSMELSKKEAIDLLASITKSLTRKSKFEFKLREHEASVDVGDDIFLFLSFSENRFALEFTWDEAAVQARIEAEEEEIQPPQLEKIVETPEPVAGSWRDEFDQELIDSGIPITETTAEESYEEPVIEQVVTATPEKTVASSEVVTPPSSSSHSMVERMTLNSTTLSYDAGYWLPSFNVHEIQAQWEMVNIDAELENKRWDPDTSVIATPGAPEPTARRAASSDDEDLFSGLGSLDKKQETVKPKARPKAAAREVDIPTKKVGAPPPGVSQKKGIPAPDKTTKVEKKATIPSPNRPGGINPMIPTAGIQEKDELDEIMEWKEPDRESISTDDDWVKPSEVLKKKRATQVGKKPVPAAEPKPAKKPASRPKPSDKTRKRRPPTPPDKKKKKGWGDDW